MTNSIQTAFALQLRSHLTLRIDPTVTLRSVSDPARFTWGFVGYTYNQAAGSGSASTTSSSGVAEALLVGKDVTDVTITGGGTIDGAGDELWWTEAKRAKADITAYASPRTFADLAAAIRATPSKGSNLPPERYAALGAIPTSNGWPRPWLAEFYGASKVTVADITATNCPMWCLGLRYSQGIDVHDLTVRNPADSPNTDRIDVVSIDDVRLARLDITTGDDNIAIKSGFPGFPTPAVPATNITIRDSIFGTGHGLSIGSEADNGVRGVTGRNLSWTGTDNGFRIKSGRDRGADIGDIHLSDLRMRDVAAPIVYTDYYTGLPKPGVDPGQPVTATTPYLHDVSITDLVATGATKSQMIGLPEAPLERMDLTNVRIEGTPTGTGLELRNVSGTFTHVTVVPGTGPDLVIEEGVRIVRR